MPGGEVLPEAEGAEEGIALQDDSGGELQTNLRQAVNGSTPTGTIQLGTPPTSMEVIFDTGSDKLVVKTWNTVKNELKQVDGSLAGTIRPTKKLYDHSSSSTYVRLYKTVGGVKKPKQGYIAYGSGMAITDEGNETLAVGGQSLEKFPLSEIAADSLAVLHRKGAAAGVLGLQHMKNRSAGESVFSRSRDLGYLTAFGYCRGPNDTGTVIWGDGATEGTGIDVLGAMHWAVKLSDLRLGNNGNESASTPSKNASGSASKGASGKEDGAGDQNTAKDGDDTFQAWRRTVDPRGSVGEALTDRYSTAKYSEALLLRQDGDGDPEGGSDDDDTEVEKKGDGGAKTKQSSDEKTPQPAPPTKTSSFCAGEACTAIIDTGSNILAGPAAALRQISRSLGVKLDCSNLDKLPALYLKLGTVEVKIPAEAYTMKVKLPEWAKPSAKHNRSIASGGGGSKAAEDEVREDNDDIEDTSTASSLVGDVSQPSAQGQWAEAGPWGPVLQDLHATRGLDLGPALDGKMLKELLAMERLCMPAFVPLDRATRLGNLWVIGTPLFEGYYTRWSWAKEDESPKIFIQDLRSSTTCQQGKEGETMVTAEDEDTADKGRQSTGTALMRAESRGAGRPPATSASRVSTAEAKSFPAASRGLSSVVERELHELRFPHWAQELLDL